MLKEEEVAVGPGRAKTHGESSPPDSSRIPPILNTAKILLHLKIHQPMATPAPAPVSDEDRKPFACIQCVQRKVKCDKRLPCLSCRKSRLQCSYRSTPPPQRRKRRIDFSSNQALLDKLRSHETTLRSAGLPFDPFDHFDDAADNDHREDADVRGGGGGGGRTMGGDEGMEHHQRLSTSAEPRDNKAMVQAQTRPPGLLVSEHGGLRYYEHAMMGILGQEYRQHPINPVNHHGLPEVTLASPHGSQEETTDAFALSALISLSSTQPVLPQQQHHHPPATAIMKYWSIFADNVHPITKIVHGPTMRQIMTDTPPPSPTSRQTNALKFAIYACAVATLTESECQNNFGQSQAILLHNFQSATRNALLDSSFLRVPNIDLLRAHALFLTSMLNSADASTLWGQMGCTMRLAQSQGLHRDGANIGLPPFETEMRRRLWWYLVTLDRRLSELMGLECSLPKSTDCRLPSNLNDSDLHPNMTAIPRAGLGASEMTFCLLKYEASQFMQEQDCGPPPQKTVKVEQRGASDLEAIFQEKFLRFCDPVIPVQFLTITTSRSILGKLRQKEHRGRWRRRNSFESQQTATTGTDQSSEVLSIATRNIEYDNLIHSSRSLRGFFWHVNFDFPWGASTFILKILANSPDWTERSHAAWAQIEELYENHPEFIHTNKVLHLVLGGLTLKAWNARQTAAAAADGGANNNINNSRHPPPLITALQHQQAAYSSRNANFGTETANMAPHEEINFADAACFDALTNGNFELMDQTLGKLDWFNWDGL